MKTVQRNKFITVLCCAVRTIALLCSTGPIMQAFLSSLGFSSELIYIHSTVVQAVNVLVIFWCSQWADNGNIVKRTALVELPYAVLYLCYLPICLWKSHSIETFLVLTGISAVQSVALALYTVCEYKLPYYVYLPEDYGEVLAISGIISALLSLGAGILISWCARHVSYNRLMLIACAASTILMSISAFLHYMHKPIAEEKLLQHRDERKNQTKVTVFQIFRYPVFAHLVPANFFRGFCYGTMTVMATVALDLGYGTDIATALVTVQSAAMLIGCVLFGFGVHRFHPKKMILIGSLTFLLLPLVLLRNDAIFLGVFAVTYLGKTLVDYGVPAALRIVVPVEIAGPYNAWRMILHNGGTLIATSVAVVIPVEGLLIITMIMQIISGLSYYLFIEMQKK